MQQSGITRLWEVKKVVRCNFLLPRNLVKTCVFVRCCYRALQEAQEIFGIDFDFDEFELADEDEEEDDIDDDVNTLSL